VQKGDLVVLTGKLEVYQNTTIEIKNGTMRLLKRGDGSSSGGNSGNGGNGGGTTTAYTDITVAKALEIGKALSANASTTEKYRVVGTVTAVKTDPANVPSKYTNINMTIKDATGTIDCYYTNYLDNKPFSSADQIPAVGTKVAVIGPLNNYNGTTVEFKNGYISEINPADIPDDDNNGSGNSGNDNNGGNNNGNDVSTDEINCIFLGEKVLPKGWLLVDNGKTKEASADNFYEDFTLKLNKIGMGLQSPEFKAVNKVTVSFQIDRLTPKSSPDKSDGTFTLCGYNSEDWPVNTAQVKTSKKGTYTIELQGQDIVYVRLVMNSFPYYGDIQCNPGIRRVDISLGK